MIGKETTVSNNHSKCYQFWHGQIFSFQQHLEPLAGGQTLTSGAELYGVEAAGDGNQTSPPHRSV